MKKLALIIFLISLGAANLHADDQLATVQQELKDQGFYYGQVDGQPGAETSAAIRRYQIRNGLQVSGTLTQETLDSLKGATTAGVPATTPAGHSQLPPVPAPLETGDQQQSQPQAQPPQPTPPLEQKISKSDHDFLSKETGVTPTPPPAPPAPPVVHARPVIATPPPPPEVVSQEAQPPPPPSQQQEPPSPLSIQYALLFTRTPYENAPLVVQQGTLRNAQALLARQTYYNGEVDGIPGPETSRAIAAYQTQLGFTQTGRLDLDTLSAMRLLPNSSPVVTSGPIVRRRVIIQPFYPPPVYVRPRVYRGNWWGD